MLAEAKPLPSAHHDTCLLNQSELDKDKDNYTLDAALLNDSTTCWISTI
jgi:hypothetical protein